MTVLARKTPSDVPPAKKKAKSDPQASKKAAAAAAADSATSSDTSDDDASTSSGDDAAPPSVSDSEDDSSDSDSEEEGGKKKEITVDFEFHDPAPIDFLGSRTLLANLTDGALPFDVSGLAGALVEQARVGTVVKTEEKGDPIAFITVFNTDRTPAAAEGEGKGKAAPAAPYPPIPALTHLRAYLLSHAPSPSAGAALSTAWAGPKTGLILAERLTNLPAEVVPPLQKALALEVGWAVSDEPTAAGRASFDFSRFLYVSRAYVEVDSAEAGEVDVQAGRAEASKEAEKKGKGKGKAAAVEGAGAPSASSPHPPLVFARPEDEHFIAHALWAWWFRVPARTARPDDELAPVRLVVCFDKDGWVKGRAGLDAMVGNAAAGEDGE